jgi:hypothetical protein
MSSRSSIRPAGPGTMVPGDTAVGLWPRVGGRGGMKVARETRRERRGVTGRPAGSHTAQSGSARSRIGLSRQLVSRPVRPAANSSVGARACQAFRAAASRAGTGSQPSWLHTILPEAEVSANHGWSWTPYPSASRPVASGQQAGHLVGEDLSLLADAGVRHRGQVDLLLPAALVDDVQGGGVVDLAGLDLHTNVVGLPQCGRPATPPATAPASRSGSPTG